MRIGMFILMLLVSFSLVQTTSAHGGEDSSVLSNIQILTFSGASSLVFFVLSSLVFKPKKIMTRPILYSLVLFTATVHLLLGFEDTLLITGGIGIFAVTFLPLFYNFSKQIYLLADFALGLIALSMLVGYFVYNNDMHFISEDYLGIVTKLAELSILIILFKQHVFAQNEEEE